MRRTFRRWLQVEPITPTELIHLGLKQDEERRAWEAAARRMRSELEGLRSTERQYRTQELERVSEFIEARALAGMGPWLPTEGAGKVLVGEASRALGLREANPIVSQGAYGDIELALQNVEWRREINLSWLEFSRWGIQQLILICRLHYIKNPLIRRGVNITAQYIFGRGIEISSSDPDADEVITDLVEANKAILGQAALSELQRQKTYDGNLFFVCFADTVATGAMQLRMIDATEVFEVVTDPNDTKRPWFYKRQWQAKEMNKDTGQVMPVNKVAYYPSLDIVEAPLPDEPTPATWKEIDGKPLLWNAPVLHRKVGAVANWHFGCPPIYPALDWAKESVRYLSACADVAQALSQIALTITTKGGMQALEGIKQQIQTNVGPQSALWDSNPPAIKGSTFAAGTGTVIEAFRTQGAGQDPEKVRRYIHMVAIVFGLPETFFADASTGSLATAQSLDRPTELCMLEAQEQWREDLVRIVTYALKVSAGATKGKLREALDRRNRQVVNIAEAKRKRRANGTQVYEAPAADSQDIDVRVTFPAIREGDVPALVGAIVQAMTLGNRGGQIVGIDEKTGARLLLEQLGVENPDELVELMYPKGEYDEDRTKEPLPAPIGRAVPDPGGQPQAPGGKDPAPIDKKVASEALRNLAEAIKRFMRERAA